MAGDELSLHGFSMIGVVRSSSDDAAFIRDLAQPDGIEGGRSERIDSILGVQVNRQARSTLEFVGQVVSRYHYDRSPGPELMWGFDKLAPDASVVLARRPYRCRGIEPGIPADHRYRCGTSGRCRSLAALGDAIITMAGSLGLKVVAEGGEDARQLEILRTMGCGYVQGYYFSRPVPGDDFLPLAVRIDAELGNG